MRDRRRVVITGMGVVSPLGNSVEELWGGLVVISKVSLLHTHTGAAKPGAKRQRRIRS